MQAPLTPKLDVLGAHLSDGSLQVGASDVGFKPFTPQREAGSSLLVVCCHVRDGVYSETVCQPLLPILM